MSALPAHVNQPRTAGPAPVAFARFTDALTRTGATVRGNGPDRAAAQCPAHEDRTASLSLTRTESGVLVHCHAGCDIEAILTALGLRAADLFDRPGTDRTGDRTSSRSGLSGGPQSGPVASYRYTDETGTVLWVKERRWPKEFRQYVPMPGGGRTWTLNGVRRVLYRLGEVQAAIEGGQTIYLTEGEKDADAMVAAGACATTWTEGAWTPGHKPKWRPEYTDALAGARVVIVADNDEPGLHTAQCIAEAISGTVDSLQVVTAKTGKDAYDHLAAGHGLQDLVPVSTPEAAPAAEPKQSQASHLVELAEETYELVLGEDGKTYAVDRNGPRIAIPLRGRDSLRQRLASTYYAKTRITPSGASLADALTVIEGMGCALDPVPIQLRVAGSTDRVVLDLGDPLGRRVIVEPGSWQVAETSPELFRRTALTAPLPVPEPCTDWRPGLAELRAVLNTDDAGFSMIVGWLMAALVADIPHPILAVMGEQGTAKSTAARFLVSLIDPSPAPLRMPPRDVRNWMVTACASWTVALDNVSFMPPWLSDTLCRAVTGDGMVDRALYTDDDVVVLAFRRAIIMTSIDAGALAGDLAERLVTVELDLIDASERTTDAGIASIYRDMRPAVLGALLTLLAQVLEALPDVEVTELPRMADFAKLLAALDQVSGWSTAATHRQTGADLTDVVLDSNPVGTALRHLMAGQAIGWTGTATELFELLTPENPHRNWPKTARGLAGQIRRLAPALRASGISVEFTRGSDSGGQRLVQLLNSAPEALPVDPA